MSNKLSTCVVLRVIRYSYTTESPITSVYPYVITMHTMYATSVHDLFVYTFPVPGGVAYNNNKENTPLELCVTCMASGRVSFSNFVVVYNQQNIMQYSGLT